MNERRCGDCGELLDGASSFCTRCAGPITAIIFERAIERLESTIVEALSCGEDDAIAARVLPMIAASTSSPTPADCSRRAYEFADALLAERAERQRRRNEGLRRES